MTAVIMFAKAPRRGYVKTRLSADVGRARALEVYRQVGAQVAAGVARGYPLTIWYDPPDAAREMRVWLGELEFQAQEGDDLGARMAHAFHVHFDRGDAPVVAIGADAPDVDAETIAQACRHLEAADVVLGPALDGGYYLIGLREKADSLFRGIPWGGPRVMAVTLAACERVQLVVRQLGALRDIDTGGDLAALGIPLT
jgi:hypothetical protein